MSQHSPISWQRRSAEMDCALKLMILRTFSQTSPSVAPSTEIYTWVTPGARVSVPIFPACHQCCSMGSSLIQGLNVLGSSMWYFLEGNVRARRKGVRRRVEGFCEYFGFLPSFILKWFYWKKQTTTNLNINAISTLLKLTAGLSFHTMKLTG